MRQKRLMRHHQHWQLHRSSGGGCMQRQGQRHACTILRPLTGICNQLEKAINNNS
jgi:hypothetical protein